MTEDTEDIQNEMQATLMLIRISRKIARRFKVCPICLMFNTADIVAEALEAGRVEHGVNDDGADWGIELSRATH